MRLLCFAIVLAMAAPALGADRPRDARSGAVTRAVEGGFASPFLADRMAAHQALLEMGADAGPHLLPRLSDPRYPVRLWTIITLGDLAYGPAIEPLLDMARSVRHFDLELSLALAKSLAKIGKTRAEVLFASLENLEGPGRRIAQKAMGLMAIKDVIAKLAPSIGPDGDSGSYEGQFRNLKPMGRAAVFALMEIAETGADSIPVQHFPDDLAKHAHNEYWTDTLKWLAVLALGELGDRAALPVLRDRFELYRSMGDMELSMTRATAFACWRLEDRGPMEALLAELTSKRRTAGFTRERLMQHFFNLGYTYNMIQRHREALRAYRSCVVLYKADTLKEANWGQIAQYNIACIHAMNGNVGAGLRALRRAIDLNYLDDRWMDLDGDLDNLRQDPRFSLCMARIMMRRADQMDPRAFHVQLNHETALEHLAEAVHRGLSPAHWVEADPLYRPLRASPAYRKLVGRLLARPVLRALGVQSLPDDDE